MLPSHIGRQSRSRQNVSYCFPSGPVTVMMTVTAQGALLRRFIWLSGSIPMSSHMRRTGIQIFPVAREEGGTKRKAARPEGSVGGKNNPPSKRGIDSREVAADEAAAVLGIGTDGACYRSAEPYWN
jgi:hypothetical protein